MPISYDDQGGMIRVISDTPIQYYEDSDGLIHVFFLNAPESEQTAPTLKSALDKFITADTVLTGVTEANNADALGP